MDFAGAMYIIAGEFYLLDGHVVIIFCKILRPLMSYLRTNGLRTMIYVNDILLCAPTHKIL